MNKIIKNSTILCLLAADIIALFMFSGCAYMYTPSTPHPTMFTRKNQFQGGISLGPGEGGFHAAFTPIKHLLFFFANLNMESQNIKEGGAGLYFNPPRSKAFLELIAGYGFSPVNYSDPFNGMDTPSSINRARGSYKKKFLQFSFAYRTKGFNGIGAGLRIAEVAFKYDYTCYEILDGLVKEYSSVEPFLFFRTRFWGPLSLTITTGRTSMAEDAMYLTVDSSYLRFGIDLHLGTIK